MGMIKSVGKNVQKKVVALIGIFALIIIILISECRSLDKTKSTESTSESKLADGEMKPFYNGEILITPLVMYDENKTERFEFKTIPGWKFVDSYFSYSSFLKENYTYHVTMQNNNSTSQILNFSFAESERNKCFFGPDYKDDVFTVYVPKYTTINTQFGALRVGTVVDSGGSQHQNYLAFCQEYPDNLNKQKSVWLNYSEVGYINFTGSGELNDDLLSDISQILKNIEVRKYQKVD